MISERTNRSFGSAQVAGSAIVLDNAANNIGGSISVRASAPTIVDGGDVQTGISQIAGTSISVAGTASFTAEASSAGSIGINLTNAGNNFGTLQLSGNTVAVRNAATTATTIGSALATTSLTLDVGGGLLQAGSIITPSLDVTAHGAVTLNNAANNVTDLGVDSSGNAISYVDANGFNVAGITAGGANLALTAGGAGNITQSAALANVGALTANAGGAITLVNAANTIGSLSASQAGSGVQINDASGGLTVNGVVRTLAGDALVRTSGDLTLASGGKLQADAGDVVAVADGSGNFVNNSGASALVTGTGRRWLVYSTTPDLVAGAHTEKGGLTSSFRHYGATYAGYAPGAVSESGNGFIYSNANATLTVGAAIVGTPSHVYGDAPTGSIGYTITSGLVDSEDSASNVISGGTATYDGSLSSAMDVGSYTFKYTGGLTSNYTLVADTHGASYSVTPATLTYTANVATRVYGAASPSMGGSISGFKLGQDASVLGGSVAWGTTATSGSNVGSYAINGSGYTAGNYVFAQASGNATAFTITKAALLVTANNDSRTYDAPPTVAARA